MVQEAYDMQILLVKHMTQLEAKPKQFYIHGKEGRLRASCPPHFSDETLAASRTVFQNQSYLISLVTRTKWSFLNKFTL